MILQHYHDESWFIMVNSGIGDIILQYQSQLRPETHEEK